MYREPNVNCICQDRWEALENPGVRWSRCQSPRRHACWRAIAVRYVPSEKVLRAGPPTKAPGHASGA